MNILTSPTLKAQVKTTVHTMWSIKLLCLVGGLASVLSVCPDKYSQVGNNCFLKGNSYMNNEESKKFCGDNAGKLVEPKSDQDIADLMKFTKSLSNMIRIGINGEGIEEKGK